MLKKNPNLLIAIFSFIVAIVGIVNNTFIITHNFRIIAYKELLNPFYLDWVFSGHSLRSNGFNYVDSFFDVILLSGAISFVASGYKQTRLIRFILSIIFLSNAFTFITLLALFVFKSYFTLWISHLPITLLSDLPNICWIYISLKTLNYLKREKALQQEFFTEGEHTQAYFVKASNWQRVWHPLVDIIVTIALSSNLLGMFVNYGAGGLFRMMVQMEDSWAEKHIALLIVCFRIVHYILSESVLGASPAKFLTKTRVIDYNGEKPSLKTIMLRTISRLVPLEWISFFIGDGWHDQWSKTIVAKEE